MPKTSVVNLDLKVYVLPGSGSLVIWTDPHPSVSKQKKVRKTLICSILWILYDFLEPGLYQNVKDPQHCQKTFSSCKYFCQLWHWIRQHGVINLNYGSILNAGSSYSTDLAPKSIPGISSQLWITALECNFIMDPPTPAPECEEQVSIWKYTSYLGSSRCRQHGGHPPAWARHQIQHKKLNPSR